MSIRIPLRPACRLAAAAAALVTATVHLSLLASAWEESSLVGAGFALLAAVCAAGAVAVAMRGTPLSWLLLALPCAAATVAYVISRTIGLAGMTDDIGNWAQPAGLTAVISQLLILAAAAAAMVARDGAAGGRHRPGVPAGQR